MASVAALLQATDIETHLVMSRSEKIALTQELDIKFNDVTAMASVARQSKK
jgi:4-hydroxy-3-polyprenylbenzoate decarboxylase